MGMYTQIMDGEVDVVDMEGLKKFLKDLKAGKNEDYIQNDKSYSDYGTNTGKEYANGVKLDAKNKILDFAGFDGWKIISYWYPLFVQFLRDVAVFLKGNIELQFENNDEGGWIEFTNGECIIHTGTMDWSEFSPKEIRPEIQPLNKELKKRLAMRRL